MPLSYNQYYGDGTTRAFNLDFDYIAKDHVEVRVDGFPVPYTWLDTYRVQTATAPANGAIVDVRRVTPRDEILVEFMDGSVLVETDLNLATIQSFFLAQEAFDQGEASLAVTPEGHYSAGLRRITMVLDPVDDRDVVTKQWALNTSNTNVAQAIAARNAAQTAQAGAETARAGAETARDQAEDARDIAVQAKVDLENARDAAAASATNAAGSEAVATAAAAGAENARDAAITARNAAQAAQSAAESANSGAEDARDAAVTAQNAAQAAQSSAEQYAYAASLSSLEAANSEYAAATSESNAAGSASAAASSAGSASTSATEAANSASAAASSASAAASSAAGAEAAKEDAEGAQLAAEDAADRAELAASGIEYPVSYAPQTLDYGQKAQVRANIDAPERIVLDVVAPSGAGVGGAVPLTLRDNSAYTIRLNTTGTGTRTGAVYNLWQESSSWKLKRLSGLSESNHPELRLNSNGDGLEVFTQHQSNYTIRLHIDVWDTDNNGGIAESFFAVPEPMPVGSTYIQMPGEAAPSSLFGGTWSLLFNTEGVFFRTEGGNASSFGGGIQGDELKSHTHSASTSSAGAHTHTVALPRTQSGDTSGSGISPGRLVSSDTVTTTSAGAHTHSVTVNSTGGAETRPRNRTVRVWKRTA